MTRIQLTLTPGDISDSFQADVSIVIDVLRASSVIITALANGCPFILPAPDTETALELRQAYPEALLAGERQAIRISGFDRGNSPFEHLQNDPPRPLILTTTNGTRTIARVTGSNEILIAGFLNLDTVANHLNSNHFSHIHVACAGTNDTFSLDDFTMAGALIHQISGRDTRLCDLSLAARSVWQNGRHDLYEALQEATHVRTLMDKGFDQDIRFCLQENRYAILPVVNHHEQLKITVNQKERPIHHKDLKA